MKLPGWLKDQTTALEELASRNTAPVLVHAEDAAFALEWVLNWVASQLCETPVAQRTDAQSPCGHCSACAMRLAGHHPDLQFLLPQALALARGMPVEVKTGVKPSQEIRIDEVRQLQAFFSTASSRGRQRFVVLYPFEALNLNTANALLKTLEEPQPGLRFVLVGHKPEQLLPTLRSRCQAYSCAPASTAQACAWLAEQGVSQPEVLLSLAGHKPCAALHMHQHEAELLDLRKKWVDWLSSPEQHPQWPAQVEKLGLPALVELAMRLCHDLTLINQLHAPVHFQWLAPRLIWAKKLRLPQLSQLFQQLSDTQQISQHPLNPRLALEILAQRWQTGVA